MAVMNTDNFLLAKAYGYARFIKCLFVIEQNKLDNIHHTNNRENTIIGNLKTMKPIVRTITRQSEKKKNLKDTRRHTVRTCSIS